MAAMAVLLVTMVVLQRRPICQYSRNLERLRPWRKCMQGFASNRSFAQRKGIVIPWRRCAALS
eukprot:7158763-Prymnesium_polylepis.1